MQKIYLISLSVFAVVCCLAIILSLTIVFTGKNSDPEINPDDYFYYGIYETAGIVSDDTRCSDIGKKVLSEYAGNALDAAIATAFCIGVVNPQASGIGGDLFLVYKNANQVEYSIDCRATAPKNVNVTYFEDGDKTTNGVNSIGVFAMVQCLHTAHEKYGKTAWKNLLVDSIELAKNYEISAILGTRIETSLTPFFEREELFSWNLGDFYNFDENRGKIAGEFIQDEELAVTYQKIADQPEDFWTAGSDILKDILSDINHLDGWFLEADFLEYPMIETDTPLRSHYANLDLDIITPPLPSGGPLLQFLLGVFDLYDIETDEPETLEYHRILEIFKFGYGARTNLGDPSFSDYIQKYAQNLTNSFYWEEIFQKIDDTTTSNNWQDYGANYTIVDDHGTSHIAALVKQEDDTFEACSITQSVNYYFGSKVKGIKTGIMFNNEMDDFSTPGVINNWGVAPSPANFVQPMKKPLSSMAPAILSKTNGQPMMVAGAAGGSKISTSIFLNIINVLNFNKILPDAVDGPRIHHQLLPMQVDYNQGFQEKILKGLENLGHELGEMGYTTSSAPLIYFNEKTGKIEAKGDLRRGDCMPSGF